MWVFGLTVSLVWWQWFLMALGGGFCLGLGYGLGAHAAARLASRL